LVKRRHDPPLKSSEWTRQPLDRWFSVAEVESRVGQSAHLLLPALKAGEYRGARRGSHWYVAAEELPRIADATDI